MAVLRLAPPPRPDPQGLPPHGAARSRRHSWYYRPGETYWLEITGRDDVGGDLGNACYDRSGRRMQSWILAQEIMRPGDTVLHFDVRSNAITARSNVDGRCIVVDDAADGWWQVQLKNHVALRPLSFATISRRSKSINELFLQLERLSLPPYYLPFVTTPRLGLRQTYLAKFPQGLITLFPRLLE